MTDKTKIQADKAKAAEQKEAKLATAVNCADAKSKTAKRQANAEIDNVAAKLSNDVRKNLKAAEEKVTEIAALKKSVTKDAQIEKHELVC